MADWLRIFPLSTHIRVVAVNEVPAGGTEPAIRLQARVYDTTVEKRFPMSSQAEADFGFGELDDTAVAHWLAGEGAKREAARARFM